MKKIQFLLPLAILVSCNSQKNIKADYEISKNEIFEISLISNPTTGYSWKWANKKPTSLLDTIGKSYIPTKVKDGIVGSGGTEIYKFKGNIVGIDTVKFEYCRSWEPNSTVETKKFIVKIK